MRPTLPGRVHHHARFTADNTELEMAISRCRAGEISAMRKLHTFHGGIHLEEHKLESSALLSKCAPIPQRLLLPLQQHIGSPAIPVVAAGDYVLKGQLLAQAEGMMSAGIHAPTSGTILSIDLHPAIHPSGLPEQCIILQADGKDHWAARTAIDFHSLPKAVLLDKRDNALLYVFDPPGDDRQGKVVIRVNYKIKARGGDGRRNAVITNSLRSGGLVDLISLTQKGFYEVLKGEL